MSKKTKRQSRRIISPAASSPVSTSARSPEREFNPDYTYVVKDLRRIGILAGSFFVGIFAMALILPLILR